MHRLKTIAMAAALALLHSPAFAAVAGGGMPWEDPLNAVMESITGPTARIIAILIIVATGLSLAFGDVGQGFKKLLQILFGLAVAFAAATFFLPLVGGGGAMLPQEKLMRDPREIPGFLAPVRQSLTQPILIGGAPRAYAILNGTLAAIIAFAGAPLWALPIGIGCHVIGVFLARRDPDFVEVLRRAMKIKARLEC